MKTPSTSTSTSTRRNTRLCHTRHTGIEIAFLNKRTVYQGVVCVIGTARRRNNLPTIVPNAPSDRRKVRRSFALRLDAASWQLKKERVINGLEDETGISVLLDKMVGGRLVAESLHAGCG